jgi:hypothetical protein
MFNMVMPFWFQVVFPTQDGFVPPRVTPTLLPGSWKTAVFPIRVCISLLP